MAEDILMAEGEAVQQVAGIEKEALRERPFRCFEFVMVLYGLMSECQGWRRLGCTRAVIKSNVQAGMWRFRQHSRWIYLHVDVI